MAFVIAHLRPDGAAPSGTGKPYFRIARRIGRRERPQAEQARPHLGLFLQRPPGHLSPRRINAVKEVIRVAYKPRSWSTLHDEPGSP